MPIPLFAAAAGSFLLNKLFSKRPQYNLPPDMEFFGPGFENVRAAQEQQVNARYGSGVNDLREILANQGVLGNQGATTDAFTRQSIAKGQDISAVDAALANTEYGAQQNFSLAKYGAGVDRNKINYMADLEARKNELSSIQALGSSLGTTLAKPPVGTVPGDIPNTIPGVPGVTPGRGAYDPSDPLYGTGLGLEQDPYHQSKLHQILKTLFGFGGGGQRAF